jgi:glycosyltransferase involved in cell wall biosynthesis
VLTNPRYSIIIPTKNGMPYLGYAIKSILSSPNANLEVIVSLDGNSQEIENLLNSITDTRLKVFRLEKSLSMSEHWDLAQSRATGQWQMFLGQDDMLMSGFEELFAQLTGIAEEAGLEVIVARRAYVCWPPLRDKNLKPLQFWYTDELSVKSSSKFASEALRTDISYHSGPQMYTSCLVASSLIQRIRNHQDGKLILGHPQDAYLAASILKHSREYLWSGSPFSWVGTSDRSAGLAITSSSASESQKQLADDYAKSVRDAEETRFTSNTDFRHGINSRYFFDALEVVNPDWLRMHVKSKMTSRVLLDASLFAAGFNIRRLHFDFRLLTSLTLMPLTVPLGIFIKLYRKIKELLIRAVSAGMGRIGKRSNRFVSIGREDSVDSLFHKAAAIRAQILRVKPRPRVG